MSTTNRKGRTTLRRAELARFLRSRRERITPTDVGLPPGLRRRTPGLRREEVAQLAGVGVTWYTWLEQGRPINPSVQVLDAISRTLRLDHAEREHLYRLANVPTLPRTSTVHWTRRSSSSSTRSTRSPPRCTPAGSTCSPGTRRSPGCSPASSSVDNTAEVRPMAAVLRAAFGRHLTEPSWTGFVHRLSAASPEFGHMWSTHDVAAPGPHIKVLR